MMSAMILPSTMLGLSLWAVAFTLVFVYRMVHVPMQIQRQLKSQGITGPRYKFVRGNTGELLKLRQQVQAGGPMSNLSHAVNPRIQPHISAWMKTYGKTFVFWIGARAQLVVSEPELIKKLLQNKEKAYPKVKPQFYIKKLMGDGLATSEGEKWLHMRKLAHNAFHGQSLKRMIPAMVSSVETMVERWSKYVGKEVDVHEEFKLLASQVIARTAFGSGYREGQTIFEMLGDLAKLIKEEHIFNFIPPGFSKLLRTKDEVEAERLEAGIREVMVGMIRKREEDSCRMAMMNGDASDEQVAMIKEFGGDFLGQLVKSFHDQSKKVSVDDVVDECKTFYVAGQHPTNFLLSWLVFLLSVHTEWQDEARNEVLSQFGRNGVPDADGISRLKIVSMIINETLRLYPPVVQINRKVDRDVHLGQLNLPANINTVIPILALHHDPEIWGEDVHLFNPLRFKDGISEATKQNPIAFMPFGLGPRNCVGSNYATNEAKIVLSMILQRYSFTLSPSYVHSIYPSMSITPKHGVQVILHAEGK